MGLFGGALEGDEVHLPNPVSETWPSLRSAVSAHRGITGASFNDSLMRVQFKTFATLGHTLSAVVSPETDGSRVLIAAVVKWQSAERHERAQIRKVAAELLADMGLRLRDLSRRDVVEEPRVSGSHLGIRGRSGDRSLRAVA